MGVSLYRPSVQRRTVIDKRSRAPFVIRYNAFRNSLTTCLEWPESGRYRQGSGTVQGLRAHAPALRRTGAGFAKTQQVYIRSEFDPHILLTIRRVLANPKLDEQWPSKEDR
jgi:hypothetical protein